MMLNSSLTCFKAYDVRGKLGEEINEDIAYRIGRAVSESLKVKSVVIGFDARETSPQLARAASAGICDSGANVFEIGLAGTEEMYFAVSQLNADAGIEITASHNPKDYNGMKIVKLGSQPLTEQEFLNIKSIAEKNDFSENQSSGRTFNRKTEVRDSYLNKILDFIDIKKLKTHKIVINSGNGAAGPVIDALEKDLSAKGIKTNFIKVLNNPDPSFPNGIPNPLLEENRFLTSNAIKKEQADFGVAFDGDFDRCFLFDHLGNLVAGEYIVGLLSGIFLQKQSGATIIHDRRVFWNTIDVVSKFGGHAVATKTGHTFIKRTMREKNAIYGGEMSAHHYFRDFSYCDSGMVPWLIIWEFLSKKNISLADLILDRRNKFHSSGEINFTVVDPTECLEKIKIYFCETAQLVDEIDGLSMSFEDWRFNLRQSNTEPLVRLNVEAKAKGSLLKQKTQELEKLILEL